ncbi:MAG TPA: tripartite tricarboxylate transporter substrate binding protein [Burkholderiales bacterium]|nr:tripartite tricarboxylate transporter substrate binding protein [Burkholderiales bacterium]
MQRIFNFMAATGLSIGAMLAAAQPGNYPDKPIRVIVPVAAGGGTDIIARIVMSKVGEGLGGTIVIDNRAGAGGILGNEIVAHAQPDGYTLLFTYAAHTIVPFIYRKVPYDVYKDFAPVTMAGSQPLLLAINASVKANTVQELIALAKSKPNELNVALATPSSSGALAAELFKILTNTQMVSVPFKGGAPALTAMVSGEVQLIFTTPPTVMPYIKGGKVRVLGTSGKDRVPYLPEVPTLAEAGIKDFNTAPWQGLLAPAGTPPAIIDKLYKQVGEVLKTPYAHERFAAAGTDVVGSSPKEFGELIKRELAQNSKVIKAVGMRAD